MNFKNFIKSKGDYGFFGKTSNGCPSVTIGTKAQLKEHLTYVPFLETNIIKKKKLKIKFQKNSFTPQETEANLETPLIGKIRKTSTLSRKAFSKKEESPNLSKISTCEENYSKNCAVQISNDHHAKDIILVCCLAYHTVVEFELSLEFTDRVKLISEKGEYSLVKNIITGQSGYVPKYCLTTVSQFLSDIKYLR